MAAGTNDKSIGPASWQIVSAARWKQVELLVQGEVRICQDWLGPLQSPNLVQMREVIQDRACNFAAQFDDTLQSVSIFFLG